MLTRRRAPQTGRQRPAQRRGLARGRRRWRTTCAQPASSGRGRRSSAAAAPETRAHLLGQGSSQQQTRRAHSGFVAWLRAMQGAPFLSQVAIASLGHPTSKSWECKWTAVAAPVPSWTTESELRKRSGLAILVGSAAAGFPFARGWRGSTLLRGLPTCTAQEVGRCLRRSARRWREDA